MSFDSPHHLHLRLEVGVLSKGMIERTFTTYANNSFVMDQQLDSITLKKAPCFFKGVVCPFPLQRSVLHL
ncbi:hypothetical protein FHY65_25815 [Bacillus cereus]|uniref:Uncharacterized protein n=1 Tax=Bacillus cereus TaxID=1396 RepID=A0A5B9I038_BACCE|nr:hypothetical protein FRY47_24535 [Bacillus cereus]QLF04872.1 hypothetical protein F3L01_25605 [Bacillus cereus]TNO99582.1 hypothetical protein FHY65_25815 [Bacillus cereus]TQR49463.1 hypothetical protein DJ027_17965 [Bacillus cereus]